MTAVIYSLFSWSLYSDSYRFLIVPYKEGTALDVKETAKQLCQCAPQVQNDATTLPGRTLSWILSLQQQSEVT
jgi:hypothetical protein